MSDVKALPRWRWTEPPTSVRDVGRWPESLTLLIPVHDEEAIIGPMLEDVARQDWVQLMGERLEVVVVDDGSGDATVEQARERSDLFASMRVLSLAPNRGKGRALQAAVRECRGSTIAFVDGDLTFNMTFFPRFMNALTDGADIVVGNRRALGTVFDIATDAIPYIHMRHVISAVFNRMVRAVTPLQAPDTQCGLKLFTAEAARRCFDRILVGGFIFDLELLIAAHEAGLRVTSVPVRLRYASTEPFGEVAVMSGNVWVDLWRVVYHMKRGDYR
jgi:dolichyl-phosphate beta-glucosyltransferase